jgi:hypothetical protein
MEDEVANTSGMASRKDAKPQRRQDMEGGKLTFRSLGSHVLLCGFASLREASFYYSKYD